MNIAPIAPAEAERLVVVKILPAQLALSPCTLRVEQPLKPNHANHRINTPSAASGDAVPKDRFGFSVPAVLADPGAENLRTNERRYAAHHIDRRGTCKIVEAEGRKPAAAPDSNRPEDNLVDDEASTDKRYKCSMQKIWYAPPLLPIMIVAARSAEHSLENKEYVWRNIAHQVFVLHREIRRADETARRYAEHQAKSDRPIDDGTE